MIFRSNSGKHLESFYISDLSPITLPQDSSVRRRVRANIAEGNPADLKGYDYRTVFYDVYQDRDTVHLSGPPLLNLGRLFSEGALSVDGIPRKPSLEEIKRTQRSWLSVPAASKTLKLQLSESVAEVGIQQADRSTFSGKNVIFTMSKNNSLNWIRDWASFYAKHHAVDGVLIYDNSSDAYSTGELLETLKSVDGISAAIIVPWPFLYGPQAPGVGAFSNFSQASMFEHARRRYLAEAKTAINVDIDELILADSGRTICDLVAESAEGWVRFAGRWIEPFRSGSLDTEPQFKDFGFYDTTARPSEPKWAVNPAKIPEQVQWRTHWLEGLPHDVTPGVLHRHFKGISTAWLYKRKPERPFDPSIHKVDDQIVAAVEAID